MANGDKKDRCDQVVGEGAYLLTAGSYKVGEGDDAETRYKFGIQINFPDMTPELTARFAEIGLKRTLSVQAAGTFNQANDYGTLEDAQAMADQYSTVEGLEKALEKAKREGGATKVDTLTSLIRKNLIFNVKGKKTEEQMLAAGLEMPPKTEKGADNWAQWAKNVPEDHPWFLAVKKSLEKAPKLD